MERCYAFEIVDSFASIAEKNLTLNGVKGGVFRVTLGVPGVKQKFKQSIYKGNKTAISLDDFCEENNVFPDVIKIDIEGFELDALKTMHNILSKRPPLDISTHPAFLRERGQNQEEVLSLLKGHGYEIIWEKGNTYFMN